MKPLNLTLTKHWFDLIELGSKIVEYREVKPYWITRLQNPNGSFKQFSHIHFTNGYGKDKPQFNIELKHIDIILTFSHTPANNEPLIVTKQYFALHLGKIIS